MIMWIWGSIAVLTVVVLFTIYRVVQLFKDQKDITEYLFNKPEQTDYIQAINENHEKYIVDVTRELNHTHGVALTVTDVETSTLYHYTTFAMISDMPVEKCAIAIVHVLDTLIAEKENA